MSLHFPLPKTRTFRFSLHTSRLSLQWVHTFRCQNFFRPLCSHSFKWREQRDEWSKTQDKRLNPAQSYYRKRFLYCAWGTLGERERYRDRRKWRHHCRAKIGDEFTLSLAKSSHKWRRVYTFPCQKFALFVSPFTLPVSPFWNGHHCGGEIRNEFTLPLPKDFFLGESLKWREPRDE